MASTQPTTSPEAPLSFMQSLSASVSLFEPQESPSNTKTGTNSPRLIVILSWFAARDAHIAKYITQHRTLFPTSRILLIRCPLDHIFFPPGVRSQLLPAVHILRAQQLDTNDGRLLIHIFSNGGMNTMARLLSMMREGEGATTSFPRHVLICDSCPGYFHWQRVHAALAQALPRWTSPFIHLGIAINWLLFAPLGYEPPPDLQARELNGKELAGVQTRRLYLYGTGDDMVDWRDVEDHAARAEEVGVDVRREVFPGSRHVAHVRVDGERYWRAVEETWEGEGRG